MLSDMIKIFKSIVAQPLISIIRDYSVSPTTLHKSLTLHPSHHDDSSVMTTPVLHPFSIMFLCVFSENPPQLFLKINEG